MSEANIAIFQTDMLLAMNPCLILLGSIGPAIIMVVIAWEIIGPERREKEYVSDIYGDIYRVTKGKANFPVLIFLAVLTYHGIKSAIHNNGFGRLFVFASIVLTSLLFLWLAYVFVRYRFKKQSGS